jgi:hypothetical protein
MEWLLRHSHNYSVLTFADATLFHHNLSFVLCESFVFVPGNREVVGLDNFSRDIVGLKTQEALFDRPGVYFWRRCELVEDVLGDLKGEGLCVCR